MTAAPDIRMKLTDFNYDLPEELIAQYPAVKRDDSRMILLDRDSSGIRETVFSNFPRYLSGGDLVVVNESRVFPARFLGEKETGASIEVLLTRRTAPGRWRALCRPSKRLGPGDGIFIGDRRHRIGIISEIGEGEWEVSLPEDMPEEDFIDSHGHVPLPPYIHREDVETDRERYQTIFARRSGSVAAPTAGLHFTDGVLRGIERRGATIVPLTLHVGPGTFRPLDNPSVEENRLEPEYFMIRKEYWEEIRDARAGGRRIIGVGTTSTRAMEALEAGVVEERSDKLVEGVEYITGWTGLYIYPGFRFRVVDALLTNLHLPMSSLFLLVCAFGGRDRIMRAYEWAIQRRYRFYSYGDAMFIR